MTAPLRVRWKLLAVIAGAWLLAAGPSALAQVIDLTNTGDAIVGGVATAGSVTFAPAGVGTVGGVNNSPMNEQAPNVLDNNTGTKYLNFAELNTGVIFTPQNTPFGARPTGIRFSTANDAPARDPLTFTLEGTQDANAVTSLNSTWTLLAQGSTTFDTDPGRLTQGTTINVTTASNFRSFRVLFPTVRDEAAANSMQVSEIDLFGVVGVPEPSSIALCGLALAGGVGGWWRRRRAS